MPEKCSKWVRNTVPPNTSSHCEATKDVRFPNVDHAACDDFLRALNTALAPVVASNCRAGSAVVTLTGEEAAVTGAAATSQHLFPL